MSKGKIFNTQEVQNILSGNKRMFRGVIKKPRHETLQDCIYKGQLKAKGFQVYFENPKARWLGEDMPTGITIKCPYQVGQKIFVKESFWVNKKSQKFCWYDNDIFECGDKVEKKPAQHMKQEHSRLTLQIKEIRVERLADISEEDAYKEGAQRTDEWTGCAEDLDFTDAFKFSWNATHKKPEEKFEANPWVWIVNFEVAK